MANMSPRVYPNLELFLKIKVRLKSSHTVFPRIVSAETILFLNLWCDNYSREESIQRRKLLFSYFFVGIHNLNCCRMVCIKQRQFQFKFKFAINMKQNM